jgi:hypothetical protein
MIPCEEFEVLHWQQNITHSFLAILFKAGNPNPNPRTLSPDPTWVSFGNMMGAHWEQGKKQKIPLPPSAQKEKTWTVLKRVCHHFWPGLKPLAKKTLPI